MMRDKDGNAGKVIAWADVSVTAFSGGDDCDESVARVVSGAVSLSDGFASFGGVSSRSLGFRCRRRAINLPVVSIEVANRVDRIESPST